jgi:Zinc-binding dehydrogenase
VIGDGAVRLSAVLAAKRLGAERILLMGRHKDRTDLGREFGATDIVAERGEEGVAAVRELTDGDGTHAVLECVGTADAIAMALGVVRDGGVVGRVGASQYTEVPMDFGTLMRNITLTGGVAPARAYIEELLPDVLDGTVQPGRVFDRTIGLDGVPDGYRAMADREALKVLVTPGPRTNASGCAGSRASSPLTLVHDRCRRGRCCGGSRRGRDRLRDGSRRCLGELAPERRGGGQGELRGGSAVRSGQYDARLGGDE